MQTSPDINVHMNNDTEKRMLASFREQVAGILNNENDWEKDYDKTIIGLETEFNVIDDEYNQVQESIRNKIIDVPFADVELGAAQMELRTDKLEIKSMDDLLNELRNNELVILSRAEDVGARIVRCGTNPFIPITRITRTDEDKYEKVPSFHDTYRNEFVPTEFGKIEKIDPRSAAIIAICNSTQCNIEAKNFDDAIKKANYSYMIAPFLEAISTNARFMEGKDTGIEEIRMRVWELSHDVRTKEQIDNNILTRTGVISSYFGSMEDYFNRISVHPFILDNPEKALGIGIGLYWKDVRIKFTDKNDIVVEFRPVSTQPTMAEDIAMHAFYIGRLGYAQKTGEPLIDINTVNRNRGLAMNNGLDCKLYSLSNGKLKVRPARDILRDELQKAEEGLHMIGVKENDFLSILKKRLEPSTNTPSKLFADGFYSAMTGGANLNAALCNGLFEARGEEYEDIKHADVYV